MTGRNVSAALAQIAAEARTSWHDLVERTFSDPALRMQALLWLHAEHDAAATDHAPMLEERYVLGLRLDAGASAAVWQAFDRKLGRNVAIKLFHLDQAGMTDALAEARAACDVISDHVVRVLDVHDGERPYIVMELVGEHDPTRGEQVPGASAAAWLPRDIDEAVRWTRDVARGVHDAHLRDVFHRDLKPHNVLVTPVSRRARVGDFGLALSAASGDSSRRALVRRGPDGVARIAGTPEYMAPEQARGLPVLDARDVEGRSRLIAIDVWGLGAILYDLLGGSVPWRADDRALEAWELAGSGARPAALARTRHGERIPARLQRVIAKAMALEPQQRYASAAELAAELDAYLAQRPTSLDRSRLLRARLFARRNPQLSLTAGAAVVLAALTLAAYVTVVDLRGRAHELADEVAARDAANRDLIARGAKTRAELDTTERSLASRGDELTRLERSLGEEQEALRAITAARDKALQDADATTRALAEQLATVRNDREAAEMGRAMYEGFWRSARDDADRATKERDQAQAERDAVRSERDQLRGERDAAREDRDRNQAALQKSDQEVKRLEASAAAYETRIAELIQKVAGTRGSGAIPPAQIDAGANANAPADAPAAPSPPRD
jgi:hypothetical protein